MAVAYAIIVAGGQGTRMQLDQPKQFIEIYEKPVLVHTIQAFFRYNPDIQIIVALPQDHLQKWNEIRDRFFSTESIEVVVGGATRFHSVRNAFMTIQNPDSIVAIHDAVRPCIPTEIIEHTFQEAKRNGSGVAVVRTKDSIRQGTLESSKSVNRNDYWIVQTPQTFQYGLLQSAYSQEYDPSFTDDASVVERTGHQIRMVEGSYQNIKITTREDLSNVRNYLK